MTHKKTFHLSGVQIAVIRLALKYYFETGAYSPNEKNIIDHLRNKVIFYE